MALKSTVYKAALEVSDLDRGVYASHALTLALHPSETEERLAMRLLAHALLADAGDGADALKAARGLSDTDEPDLWQHDLSGQLLHWVEVGLPDERRLARAAARARRVTVYAYASSTPVWWSALESRVTRLANLEIWQVAAAESQALAARMRRALQWQLTVQDGLVWVSDGEATVELQPRRLWPR